MSFHTFPAFRFCFAQSPSCLRFVFLNTFKTIDIILKCLHGIYFNKFCSSTLMFWAKSNIKQYIFVYIAVFHSIHIIKKLITTILTWLNIWNDYYDRPKFGKIYLNVLKLKYSSELGQHHSHSCLDYLRHKVISPHGNNCVDRMKSCPKRWRTLSICAILHLKNDRQYNCFLSIC